MNSQLTAYITLICTSGVLNLYLCFYVFVKRYNYTNIANFLETQPLITTEGVISVTLSSGVAEATKEKDETLYQLLNKADKALYTAKREGRNQVQVYTGV